ncbi:MAG: hypothetical protein AAF487_14135 [Bacteroidota bacterium]
MVSLIHFDDLISSVQENAEISRQFDLIQRSSEQEIFKVTRDFINKHKEIDLLIVCAGAIPNWTEMDWSNFSNIGAQYGACKFGLDQNVMKAHPDVKPYIAAFNAADLRMALDQNYRPNFEDLCVAMSTFGFPVKIFESQNVLN